MEVVCERKGEWDKVLDCYTNDPQRQMQAFVFVQKVFIESDLYTNGSLHSSNRKGMVEKSVVTILFFSLYNIVPNRILYDRCGS